MFQTHNYCDGAILRYVSTWLYTVSTVNKTARRYQAGHLVSTKVPLSLNICTGPYTSEQSLSFQAGSHAVLHPPGENNSLEERLLLTMLQDSVSPGINWHSGRPDQCGPGWKRSFALGSLRRSPFLAMCPGGQSKKVVASMMRVSRSLACLGSHGCPRVWKGLIQCCVPYRSVRYTCFEPSSPLVHS